MARFEIDWKKLCDDSNRIAAEHGWNDPPRTVDDDVALFHSELSEALEDFRSGEALSRIFYEDVASKQRVEEHELPGVDHEAAGADKFKPCGIPTELADFLIRLAHHAGQHGCAEEFNPYRIAQEFASAGGDALPRILSRLHAQVSKFFNRGLLSELEVAAALVVDFCAREGIDLARALKEKQRFNETRPFKHGGKRI